MSQKALSYVPVEKVTAVIKNKYEAVVVAAREARKINSVLRMVGREDAQVKVTSRALKRVGVGDVDYVYLDEQNNLDEPVQEQSETTENNEQAPPAS